MIPPETGGVQDLTGGGVEHVPDFLVEDDDGIASQVERHLTAWGRAVPWPPTCAGVAEEVRGLGAPPGANAGHRTALPQRLPLVHGDPKGGAGAHHLSLLRRRQHERGHGHEPGRGRLHRQAPLTWTLIARFRPCCAGPTTSTPPRLCWSAGGGAGHGGQHQLRGEKLELTRNEYRILQVLLEQKADGVLETLMRKLWGDGQLRDENTLTVNITRLRRRLESVGLVDLIHTKRAWATWWE